MRKPGTVQLSCLKSLIDRGPWSRKGCGWYWDTQSGTERIMKSLLRRGWVTAKKHPTRGVTQYVITDTGRALVG